jgi:RecB family endonuclease NucS
VIANAFAGGIISAVVLVVLLLLFIYIEDRVKAKKEPEKQQKPKTMQEDFLERHLEELVVANFDHLFPAWSIYQVEVDTNNRTKLPGIRYRSTAGEIDILCTDENNNFVVIELKRNKTPDQVVTQVDRYIAWVERHLAQPGQTVRGIIIAKKHSDLVIYSASRKGDIELWTYELNLALQSALPEPKAR